ncbi:MAG TPA: hypothetical protein VFW05_06745 [Verrucomicrobiae bacterium]|jgi:hypothetical protein|nr:hypothetical protein [Verrucomicrobiae bacterium]
MDAEELDICNFLKASPGEYVTGREICRRAGGKWRYRENENWAFPVLAKLVERKVIEPNSSGQFRLIMKKKKNEKPRWVAPHIRAILESSGKTFDLGDEE